MLLIQMNQNSHRRTVTKIDRYTDLQSSTITHATIWRNVVSILSSAVLCKDLYLFIQKTSVNQSRKKVAQVLTISMMK